VLRGHGIHSVDICWVPEDVNGHDRANPATRGPTDQPPRGDVALVLEQRREPLRIELTVPRLGIDEDRMGAHVADGERRGDEAQRRNDDLVPGPDSGHEEREMQCRGPAGHAHGMADPEQAPHLRFEPLDERAICDPARSQAFVDESPLELADVG
jgi:hypothetical protein